METKPTEILEGVLLTGPGISRHSVALLHLLELVLPCVGLVHEERVVLREGAGVQKGALHVLGLPTLAGVAGDHLAGGNVSRWVQAATQRCGKER